MKQMQVSGALCSRASRVTAQSDFPDTHLAPVVYHPLGRQVCTILLIPACMCAVYLCAGEGEPVHSEGWPHRPADHHRCAWPGGQGELLEGMNQLIGCPKGLATHGCATWVCLYNCCLFSENLSIHTADAQPSSLLRCTSGAGPDAQPGRNWP